MTRTSVLWLKCTSVFKTLSWNLGNSPNLHILLLLCLPSISLIAVGRPTNNYGGTRAVGFWEKPGQRDVFETPAHSSWLAFYALLSVTFVFSLVAHRNNPQHMMQVMFRLHFLITTTIHSLSTFSGWITQPVWSSLIWNSNPPGKICWLWLLVECGCWNWTYLGFHDDYYFDETTRTVHDRNSNSIWTFTSEKTGDPEEDRMYTPYNLMFRPWRDIAVRLSYIHLIDNTIHVIWSRYLHVDAPYTAYINNSEILTILLFFSLAVYTYARMDTHVYFDDTVTGPLVNFKSTVPLPQYSATRDLFTFASPHHAFRTASESRQIFMISMCVMATAAMTTWELHPWVPYFWEIIEYVVVTIIVEVLTNSWREYGKTWKTGTPEVQSPEQVQYHGGAIAVV
jgi:hypothetical protein